MKSRHDGSKEAQITPGRLTRLQMLVVTLFSSAIKQLEMGLCCEGSCFKYFGKAYYGHLESLRSATMIFDFKLLVAERLPYFDPTETSNEKEIGQPVNHSRQSN